MQLAGLTALVTGGGTGIGRGIALKLAESGAHVVVNGRRRGPCEEVAAEIAREGGTATVVTGDIADPDQVEQVFRTIAADVGPLHVLVNNAGIQRVAWFDRISLEDWEEVIRINLTGPFLCSQHFARQMRANRYGRIINIGSEGALVGSVGNANYVAAKAGLMGLTMNLALEMAIWARKDGGDYTCNLIHPGYNESEMSAGHSEEQLQRVLASIPLGRPADSRNEIGAVVAFLASPGASYVTGAKFSAGGGVGMCMAS
jgi:3-oxoacyl-[acyl-carrier protein] reductase